MAAVIPQPPATGRREDWNEAWRRVDDYLRAHRLTDRFVRFGLVSLIVQEAGRKHASESWRDPVSLSLEEAIRATDKWYASLVGIRDEGARQASMGKLAFAAIFGEKRLQHLWMTRVPDPVREEMHRISLRNGPDLQIASMTPRDLDFGTLETLVEQPWERYEWIFVLPAVGLWALFFYGIFRLWL